MANFSIGSSLDAPGGRARHPQAARELPVRGGAGSVRVDHNENEPVEKRLDHAAADGADLLSSE